MKLVITTQSELDAIKLDFNGEIVITGGTIGTPIKLKEYYPDAEVILSGNAVVSMYGKSQVNVMWESSQVKEMWGSSLVAKILGQNNKVSCFGFNYLFVEKGVSVSGIKLNDTSQIIFFDSFKTSPSIQFYLKNYPVKESGGMLTMFKSVHKTDTGFISDHDRSFRYEIGETKTHAVSQNLDDSCDVGIHVSHLQWAVDFGKSWNDMAILELEVPMDWAVVAKDCDGKVRTGVARVVREVPIEEYQQYL